MSSEILNSEPLRFCRIQLVVFLVLSSFPNYVLREVLLFQTSTILWHSNLHGATTASAHTLNCHISLFVSFKKLKRVGQCLLCRDGRATCSWTTHHLHRSRRTISWWGFVSMQRWKKWQPFPSRNSYRAVPVIFLRSLPVLHYRLLLHIPSWVRASLVFVPR